MKLIVRFLLFSSFLILFNNSVYSQQLIYNYVPLISSQICCESYRTIRRHVNVDEDKFKFKSRIAEEDIQPSFTLANSPKPLPKPAEREIMLEATEKSNGARLRVIDKIYGTTHEISVFSSFELMYDSLKINLSECYYNNENLQKDSIALVKISHSNSNYRLYDGWMSSRYSHLTNYNNYRYNLWLLSCITSDQE